MRAIYMLGRHRLSHREIITTAAEVDREVGKPCCIRVVLVRGPQAVAGDGIHLSTLMSMSVPGRMPMSVPGRMPMSVPGRMPISVPVAMPLATRGTAVQMQMPHTGSTRIRGAEHL
jgi:hypothetical protein